MAILTKQQESMLETIRNELRKKKNEAFSRHSEGDLQQYLDNFKGIRENIAKEQAARGLEEVEVGRKELKEIAEFEKELKRIIVEKRHPGFGFTPEHFAGLGKPSESVAEEFDIFSDLGKGAGKEAAPKKDQPKGSAAQPSMQRSAVRQGDILGLTDDKQFSNLQTKLARGLGFESNNREFENLTKQLKTRENEITKAMKGGSSPARVSSALKNFETAVNRREALRQELVRKKISELFGELDKIGDKYRRMDDKAAREFGRENADKFNKDLKRVEQIEREVNLIMDEAKRSNIQTRAGKAQDPKFTQHFDVVTKIRERIDGLVNDFRQWRDDYVGSVKELGSNLGIRAQEAGKKFRGTARLGTSAFEFSEQDAKENINDLLAADTKENYQSAVERGKGWGGKGREARREGREEDFKDIQSIKGKLKSISNMSPSDKAVVLYEILNKKLAKTGGTFNLTSKSAFGTVLKEEIANIKKVFPDVEKRFNQKVTEFKQKLTQVEAGRKQMLPVLKRLDDVQDKTVAINKALNELVGAGKFGAAQQKTSIMDKIAVLKRDLAETQKRFDTYETPIPFRESKNKGAYEYTKKVISDTKAAISALEKADRTLAEADRVVKEPAEVLKQNRNLENNDHYIRAKTAADRTSKLIDGVRQSSWFKATVAEKAPQIGVTAEKWKSVAANISDADKTKGKGMTAPSPKSEKGLRFEIQPQEEGATGVYKKADAKKIPKLESPKGTQQASTPKRKKH